MKLLALISLTAVLCACASLPQPATPDPSPCAASEASYECQVERYRNVHAD